MATLAEYWQAKDALDALPPAGDETNEYLRLNRAVDVAHRGLSVKDKAKAAIGLRK